MSKHEDGRFKRFFKTIGGYAKAHPWKTAGFVIAAAAGLVIIAGGIVLIATSPASFGGGAAVGVPLLGVGVGLAGGAVVIALGVVLTGTATGLFWRSSKKDELRREVNKNVRKVNLASTETEERRPEPKAAPAAKPKKSRLKNIARIFRRVGPQKNSESKSGVHSEGIFSHTHDQHGSAKDNTKDRDRSDKKDEGSKDENSLHH